MTKVLISGAGIAGLTVAIALRSHGVEVEIFEKAPTLEEFGAGLQLSPNGTRILSALGVSLEQAFYPQNIIMKNGRSGRSLFKLPIQAHSRQKWGGSYVHIHRADLQSALISRLEALGGAQFHMGCGVTEFEDIGNSIRIEGTEGDYLIAADGVHSPLREFAFGGDRARFSGRVAWRLTVPLERLDFDPPDAAVIWAGHRQHAVTTRIRSGELVNFVAITEDDDWREEGWNHAVNLDQIAALFDGWDPRLKQVISRAQTAHRWALLRRDAIPRYDVGRVVFIGDAAHPMLPSLAQGAVQAIEDAYTIAEIIARSEPLAEFGHLRGKRIARVQRESWRAMDRYHRGGSWRLMSHNAAAIAGRLAPNQVLASFNWLYAHDALTAIEDDQ